MLTILNYNAIRHERIIHTPFNIGQVDEKDDAYLVFCKINPFRPGLIISIDRKPVMFKEENGDTYEMFQIWVEKEKIIQRTYIDVSDLKSKQRLFEAFAKILL